MTSWKHWYRVDAVPRRWWPVYVPVSYFLAALLWFYVRLVRATCRIEWEGGEHRSLANYIWVCWHEHVYLIWISQGDFHGHGWLNHPYWYMRPIHLAACWDGVATLYLGSSGVGGREALARLVEGMKQGQNTLMMPDGPAGPRRKLRPGAAMLAAATGVPIVPFRFAPTRCLRLGGWDDKAFPVPFLSRWKVTLGAPIFVEPGGEEAAGRRVQEALGTAKS